MTSKTPSSQSERGEWCVNGSPAADPRRVVPVMSRGMVTSLESEGDVGRPADGDDDHDDDAA